MLATDIETWALDHMDGRVIRYQIYRRMFTPYEQEQKFSDESPYENGYYMSFGYIAGVIDLGCGEWLICIQSCDENTFEPYDIYEYHKLSDIKLYFYEYDMEQKRKIEEEEE